MKNVEPIKLITALLSIVLMYFYGKLIITEINTLYCLELTNKLIRGLSSIFSLWSTALLLIIIEIIHTRFKH